MFAGSEFPGGRHKLSRMSGKPLIARHVGLFLVLIAAMSTTAQEVVRMDPPADYIATGSFQLDSRAGGTAGPLDPLLGKTNQFRISLNDAELRHTFTAG